ncbi:MAG: hypothetical protein AAB631_02315 [Patescibacteria group bacterium]
MKYFTLAVFFVLANTALPAQQTWTLNKERGPKVSVTKEAVVKTTFNGAEGIFKIEIPKSGWEYDGPMDLPIVTIDRHISYESSKCTPNVHAIGCPGSCSAIINGNTKLTVMNRKINRGELDLLNGKRVVVVGKIQQKKDSEYNTHDYWSELTIMIVEKGR